MPTAVQETDSRFAVFLNPIRDLTKNWEVDISKVLQEYLDQLQEIRITFDMGENTTMNFAEAAMLVQGSANVYSKKVEWLYQLVLQMLDTLASRQPSDNVGANDANCPASRARGSNASMAFSFWEDVGGNKNPNIPDDEDNNLEENIRCFNVMVQGPSYISDQESGKGGDPGAGHRQEVTQNDLEVIGNKNDFRLSDVFCSASGNLEMDTQTLALHKLFRVRRKKDDDSKGNAAPEAVGGIEGTHPAPMLFPQEVGPVVQPLDVVADLDDLLSKPINDDEPPASPMANDDDFFDNNSLPEKTDIDVKDEVNDVNENLIKKTDDLVTTLRGPSARNAAKRNKEKLANACPEEQWKAIDPFYEGIKRPIRVARVKRPVRCACHRPIGQAEKRSAKLPLKKTLLEIETLITNDFLGFSESEKLKGPIELLELLREEQKRRGIVGKKGEEEGEENIHELGEDNDAAVDMDDDFSSNHIDDLPAPPQFFPELGPVPGSGCFPAALILNDSQLGYEPGNEYEALVQELVCEYVRNAQEYITSTELAKRVNTWRKNIGPKLEAEEGRQEFDIHDYGSWVLDHFPHDGRKTTVSFEDVVQGEETREVSRIFLSCLMLANTENIDLAQADPSDFAMDCLELTLLSRVRHHEEMQDYLPPSQSSPVKRKGAGNQTRKFANGIPIGRSLSPSSLQAPISPHLGNSRDEFRSKKRRKQ